jgi:hypothetical protein
MSKFALAVTGALVLTVPCHAADFAPMALNGFSFVPKGLRTALVFDENGKAIGIVQKVEADGSGKPHSLDIMSPGGRLHQISAGQASYDPVSNVVVTNDFDILTADARQSGLNPVP